MLDAANTGLRPSFYEMEWRARHHRREVRNALMRETACGFVRWLRVLVRAGGRLAHGFTSQAKTDGPGRTDPGIASR